MSSVQGTLHFALWLWHLGLGLGLGLGFGISNQHHQYAIWEIATLHAHTHTHTHTPASHNHNNSKFKYTTNNTQVFSMLGALLRASLSSILGLGAGAHTQTAPPRACPILLYTPVTVAPPLARWRPAACSSPDHFLHSHLHFHLPLPPSLSPPLSLPAATPPRPLRRR